MKKKILSSLLVINAFVADVNTTRSFIIKVSAAFCFTYIYYSCTLNFDSFSKLFHSFIQFCQFFNSFCFFFDQSQQFCFSFLLVFDFVSNFSFIQVQFFQSPLPDFLISWNRSVSRSCSTTKLSEYHLHFFSFYFKI